jgi:hypothetical protein
MVRLNLFTLILAYTMNTDYISYYFSPLVSMWYLVTYGTMAIASQFNDRTPFLVAKIFISAGLMTWFMSETWFLETIFDFLSRFCGIHWSAREWSFRVNLDLWIVYVGMLTALAVIKAREYRFTDHPHWPTIMKVAIGTSGGILFWFFAFELLQENKFTYNTWHPYISFLPITAFVVLRNANPVLRSASSKAFAFIGRCSLETFIIQYHFWLAADTKGILLVLTGTRWRPANFVITTVMFIYVSHRVAQATAVITTLICGNRTDHSLPMTATSSVHRRVGSECGPDAILLTLSAKDNEENPLPPVDDTPIRWMDRLAEGSLQQGRTHRFEFKMWYGYREWGVGTKLAAALAFMWVLNTLWTYP